MKCALTLVVCAVCLRMKVCALLVALCASASAFRPNSVHYAPLRRAHAPRVASAPVMSGCMRACSGRRAVILNVVGGSGGIGMWCVPCV